MSGALEAPAPATGEDGRREQNKAENRAKILAAARDVFTELGYEGATVRDIVRRTDLASGTFYNYFPDKKSVFRALLYEMELRRRALRREATRDAVDLAGFLEGGYRAYFEHVASDLPMFEMMRRNSGVLGGFFEDPMLMEGAEAMHVGIKQAIVRGEVPAVDAEYLAGAFIGIAWEVAVRMSRRRNPDVQEATELATQMALGGLERIARRGRAR